MKRLIEYLTGIIIMSNFLKYLLFISLCITAVLSFAVHAGIPTETVTLDPIVVEPEINTIETTVLLPESYSRSVTGQFDTTQYPDQPVYALTIDRLLDNSLLVTIALVDTILDPNGEIDPPLIIVEPPELGVDPPDLTLDPVVGCDPLEGTSMSELYGLLTRWENLYSDDVTPQQAFNSVGSMFSDTDNLKTRIKSIRMLLKGSCE